MQKIIKSPFTDDVSFKYSSSPIVILNQDFQVSDINLAAQEILGYNPEEARGRNIIEFTVATEFDINFQLLNLLKEGRIPNYKVFKKFKHKLGNLINFELQISLIKSPKENQIFYSGIFNKLDLISAKRFLKLRTNNLATITEHSPVIQYIWDVQKKERIYTSKNFLTYLGYDINDAVGFKSQFEFLKTKILGNYVRELNVKSRRYLKSKDPKETFTIEYPIYNSENKIVWVYNKSVALKVNNKGEKIYSHGTLIDITDRKEKEEQIKNQQIFISKISESIPSFIYMLESKSQVVYFSNKRAESVLGYNEIEFNLLLKEELVHPAFFVDYMKSMDEFLKSKEEYSFQIKIKLKHKTKGYRWFNLKSIVFDRNENHEILNVLNIIDDINENQLNLHKIEEQQQFFRNITSKLPSIVYVTNLITQKVMFLNIASKEIIGYPYETFMKDLKKIIHPLYLEEQIVQTKKFIQSRSNETLDSEILLMHKTKGYRWYNVRLKIIKRDVNDRPEQMLEIIDDIHDVKMKNIKIAEQENLIKKITNSMTSFIYLFDLEKLVYTYSNFEHRKILGYTKNEYLGKSLSLVHPKYLKKTLEFGRYIKNDITQDTFEMELTIKHKTKGYIWVKYKVNVVDRFEDGKPKNLLEIVENINDSTLRNIQIREQQDLIEKISSSIPDFIYLRNLKTFQTVFSNQKAVELLGYSETEFFEKDINVYVDKGQIDSLIQHNQSILDSKDQNVFLKEILIKHKTKGPRWYKSTTIIFERDEKQQPITILEMLSDIHDLKQKEIQIAEQQKFISNISSTIPQYLSVYDLKTKSFVYTNFENKLIFGYTRNEYITLGDQIIHPDFREKRIELIQQLTRSKKVPKSNSIEYLIKHKNGTYNWTKLKVIVSSRDKKGRALQILIIMEDINEPKLSFNKVLEQQNFIQKVAATVPNIIQVIDVQSLKHVYSNFEDRKFLGYNKEEWAVQSFSIIHKKHHQDYLSKIIDLISSNSNKLIKDEILIRNKSGEFKWVSAINSVFKIKDNRVQQIMSVFSNINENKELHLKLEKQLSKNIELERFASITSHDLKEPLRTLGNYAQILQTEYQDELQQDALELVDHIEKSSKRMNELINDILDFSKVHTEGRKFQLINLDELTNIVLDDLKDLILDTNTEINIKNLPIIEGDKTQLRQVFQNLISNAIKFTKGKKPIININVEYTNEKYIISVQDNGIGMKPSDQINIFKIFKKLHRQNEFEGQGIGLSICKRIIERHDGEIWLESEVGKGTTFFFSLPRHISCVD